MNTAQADRAQLQTWQQDLLTQYQSIRNEALNLDLTRGKPSAEQLNLSDALDGILNGDYTSKNGTDVRNYGGLEGIEEARELGAILFGVPASLVMAGGSSSLNLMYEFISIAHQFGLGGEDSAWQATKKVSFICPVPGYDRHFTVCQQLGINMITVPMNADGPDMDAIENLLLEDPSIRGLWCVPKYSNPTGVTYSDAVVERIAALGKISHRDFRVFWDNAYAVHDLSDRPPSLLNIHSACQAAGTEDSVIQFASTSKITHAGAGVAFIAASEQNLRGFKRALSSMTIGPDKVNQLRHARFFADAGSLTRHMQKHAAVVKPKFDIVLSALEQAFADNGLGKWETPEGGYFISFNTRPGLAKAVVKLAADVGVKLTPAGATFPYGHDPEDRNIRIAPTVPKIEQVEKAMAVFVLCVKLASVQQALAQ